MDVLQEKEENTLNSMGRVLHNEIANGMWPTSDGRLGHQWFPITAIYAYQHDAYRPIYLPDCCLPFIHFTAYQRVITYKVMIWFAVSFKRKRTPSCQYMSMTALMKHGIVFCSQTWDRKQLKNCVLRSCHLLDSPRGALGYLGGRIRSLSKLKNTPKALISGQKSTLILIKTLTFST